MAMPTFLTGLYRSLTAERSSHGTKRDISTFEQDREVPAIIALDDEKPSKRQKLDGNDGIQPARQSSLNGPRVAAGRPQRQDRPRVSNKRSPPAFPLQLLSKEFSHTKHTDDCFVSHLLDAVRMWRLKRDIEQAVKTIERQFVDQQGLAVQCATRALRPLKLNALKYYFDRNRKIFESGRAARDSAYEESLELKGRLRSVETACRKAIAQVFQTAEDFCKKLVDFDRSGHQQVLRMGNGFGLVLKLARLCDNQILEKEKQVKQLLKRATDAGVEVRRLATQPDIDPEALLTAKRRRRALQENYDRLKKFLEATKEEQELRMNDLLTDLAPFTLGERLPGTNELTKHNLQKLPTATIDQDPRFFASLQLQKGRITDGRLRKNLNGRAAIPIQAQDFYAAKRQVREAEARLHNIRENYVPDLARHLLAFPASSQEEFGQIRAKMNKPDFHTQEQEALAGLKEAKEAFEITRKAMRDYINTQPAPSESSFAGRTSDFNASDSPLAAIEWAEKWVPPAKIRNWHAKVAMSGVAGYVDPDELLLSDDGDLAEATTVESRTTAGHASCNDEVELTRRKKLLLRYQALIEGQRSGVEAHYLAWKQDHEEQEWEDVEEAEEDVDGEWESIDDDDEDGTEGGGERQALEEGENDAIIYVG